MFYRVISVILLYYIHVIHVLVLSIKKYKFIKFISGPKFLFFHKINNKSYPFELASTGGSNKWPTFLLYCIPRIRKGSRRHIRTEFYQAC